MAEGYACYRPVGKVSLQEALHLMTKAIAYAREKNVKRLLVNCTLLTGWDLPSTWDRFNMAEQFAQEARASLIAVMVTTDERIDPRRFGVTVARNRGLFSNVFTTEAEAIAWLLDPHAE
jgi:hypothetical protein